MPVASSAASFWRVVGQPDQRCQVRNDEDEIVAHCRSREDAESIVRDHNAALEEARWGLARAQT